MSSVAKMVFDDPAKFSLLTLDMKEKCIKAATGSVNIAVALTRREAIKNQKSSFTLRNTFTTRQTQFTPMAEGRYALHAIHAEVGATEKAPWMKRQEEGGIHRPSKGKTLAVPTDYARGGSKRAQVRAEMRINRIKKHQRVRSPLRTDYAFWFRSQKAQKVARAYIAYREKLFIPIGDTKEQRNLFIVTKFHVQKVAKGKGYKERAKHRSIAFELKQVYKFDKPETTTKPEPWLLPASEKIGKQMQAIFNAQMKKLGLL